MAGVHGLGDPVAFKEKMAALCVHYDCLRPVYCSQFDEATALAEIRRREAPEKVRITTGLDNDDALHPRMVEHVQELARARLGAVDLAKGFFISFPLGCCECQGRFYLVRDKANPFVSFVSAPECPATVVGRIRPTWENWPPWSIVRPARSGARPSIRIMCPITGAVSIGPVVVKARLPTSGTSRPPPPTVNKSAV